MTEAPPLPADVACLVRLSAAMAADDDADVEMELRRACVEVDLRQVDETIVQSCLFLGFPAALEAAGAWRGIRGSAPADDDPLAPATRATERAERGERLCRRVYGRAYDALRANVADANPTLDRLMVETGYGTVLARPGLEPATRELCLVAVLAVQARDRQLYSHLRGALRTGAPPAWVEGALGVGLSRAPVSARDRLRELWHQVRERSDASERSSDVR
ncbi:MAG TPA: carboxymuconolactone decarboxylase family protein [Gemmatimonadota bacterium]|nr:carboxymuconolactone decarboxylase family protein [Gemmatimonadota bacterium]